MGKTFHSKHEFKKLVKELGYGSAGISSIRRGMRRRKNS